MYRNRPTSSVSVATRPSLSPAILRAGFALAVLTALSAFAFRAGAQSPSKALDIRPLAKLASATATESARVTTVAPVSATVAPRTAVFFAPAPFAVGEELTYRATFGVLPAGSARMRVDGIELVRGRPAYHVVFSIDGGVPFFRVKDRYESWIDIQTLASLRHRQVISEGRYHRNTTFEIFPERAMFQRDSEAPEPSVANPLDDGSFIYAVRAEHLNIGETRRDDRYFRPDRNPVILTGLRRDTVTVNAGTFNTMVVRPSIKANGLFSENGDAQIWFTDDAARYPVQVKTKFSKFSLTLSLQSITAGDRSAHARLVSTATDAQ